MQSVTSATAVATTARANDITLYASLELSKSKWVVTITIRAARSFPSMWLRVETALASRASFAVDGEGRAALRRAGQAIVIEEAGLDGFWIIDCCSPTD